MKTGRIHLSADLGEGAGSEELMMPYLSSCNIACGGHYGNRDSMLQAIQCANKNGVQVGAHPSYPDLDNFGRSVMDISDAALQDSLTEQLQSIKVIATELETPIRHVKAHGALYHQIVKHKSTREAYLNSIDSVLGKVKIVLPLHVKAVEIGIEESRVIYEAFGDRLYNETLELVSRSEPNSILDTAEDIADQIFNLSIHSKVRTAKKNISSVRFQTICLHGDHPRLSTYFPKLISLLQSKKLSL